MNDPRRALVFDVGGTKLSAGLADRQGHITHRQELPTLASEGRDAILGRIDRLGHAVLAEARRGRSGGCGGCHRRAGQFGHRCGGVRHAQSARLERA